MLENGGWGVPAADRPWAYATRRTLLTWLENIAYTAQPRCRLSRKRSKNGTQFAILATGHLGEGSQIITSQ
jgi:hypothetical protein